MRTVKLRRGIIAGQLESAFVRWEHGRALKTSDPENDEMRAFYLPRRLREAGYDALADAFELLGVKGDVSLSAEQRWEQWGLDLKPATEAALLIAGHMAGPSLGFAGRPVGRSQTFAHLLREAKLRVQRGEHRCDVVAALVAPLYADGRAAGHDLPATPKALREKLNRALVRASKQRAEIHPGIITGDNPT